MKKCKTAFVGRRGHLGYALRGMKLLGDTAIAAGVTADGGDDAKSVQNAVETYLGYPVALFPDCISMLDAVRPDILVVNGAFENHAALSIAALERNIHVFCEKPLALTLDELNAVEKAYGASAPGTCIISMVGMRCESAMHTAFEAVRSGAIGKVKMVSSRKSYKLGIRPEFYKNRATYGGTIPWVGSHALDLMLYFGGASGFDSIFAFHNRKDNQNNGDLEMCAVCCGRLNNGVITSCTIDYLRPESAETHGDDRVRVAGTAGVIEVADGQVTLLNPSGKQILPLLPPRELFYDFVQHIQGKGAAPVTAGETFALTRACLEAREFADSRLFRNSDPK